MRDNSFLGASALSFGERGAEVRLGECKLKLDLSLLQRVARRRYMLPVK